MPISSGSTQRLRSRGIHQWRQPPFLAVRASMTTHADEPSENWLALPAVMTLRQCRANFRDSSSVVSGRMPSSAFTVIWRVTISFRALVEDACP